MDSLDGDSIEVETIPQPEKSYPEELPEDVAPVDKPESKAKRDSADNPIEGVRALSSFAFKNMARLLGCVPLLTSEDDANILEFSESLKTCLDSYGLKIPAFVMPIVHGVKTGQGLFGRRKRKPGPVAVAT